MLKAIDILIICIGIIGIIFAGIGITSSQKVLKSHKKIYQDEEYLTEKESGLILKYMKFILVGCIFTTIFFGMQLLRLIFKVD